MPFQVHELKYLIETEPRKAARMLLDEYERCDANWTTVRTRLEVSERTLRRWVAELNIERDVEEIRAKKARVLLAKRRANGQRNGPSGGWPAGRPRKVKS